jgi:hypothetical protein
MSFELLFWIIMLFWLITGWLWNSNPTLFGAWGWMPNTFLLWVLLALLGWKVYGPMLHG